MTDGTEAGAPTGYVWDTGDGTGNTEGLSAEPDGIDAEFDGEDPLVLWCGEDGKSEGTEAGAATVVVGADGAFVSDESMGILSGVGVG
jgi:hypothetical protein